MTHSVDHLLTPPTGWNWDSFNNKNGQKMRYGWNAPAKSPAKALIVLAEGRTECIEEYFELIRDLNDNGYACAIMDWQGQGESYRYFDDNTRHHSEGVIHDIAEFDLFMNALNGNKIISALPQIALAHSMGGNYLSRYLAEYNHIFKGVYLIAPMLGLNPKFIIRYTAKPILSLMRKVNRLHKHAFGQRRWSETFADIAKHKVSSDPVRRNLQPYLFKNHPKLQCGGVTFGWLNEALKSTTILHNENYCSRITVPVHMAIAENDFVVDNNGLHKTAAALPHCDIEVFEGSEHQIHREKDTIRDAFLKSFFNFCEKRNAP